MDQWAIENRNCSSHQFRECTLQRKNICTSQRCWYKVARIVAAVDRIRSRRRMSGHRRVGDSHRSNCTDIRLAYLHIAVDIFFLWYGCSPSFHTHSLCIVSHRTCHHNHCDRLKIKCFEFKPNLMFNPETDICLPQTRAASRQSPLSQM